MTITEFLEARIAEDEALAREAEKWADDGPEPHLRWLGDGNDRLVNRFRQAGPHMAHWSPARVLAECAGKRALVEAVDTYLDSCGCVNSDVTLQILAAVYAEHPDYRQEWAL